MQTQYPDEKIAIVGAGLVGSLTAIFLARRGYPVEIYERNHDTRHQARGTWRSSINLSLSDRAFLALERVGLAQRVRDATVPTFGRLIHEADGEVREQPYGKLEPKATYTILRSDLNHILLDAAEDLGVVTHFGEKCLDVDLQSGTLTFRNAENGDIHDVDATRVFGADGLNSAIRQRLQKTKPFNLEQQYLDHGYIELNVPTDANGGWTSRTDCVHLWPRGDYMLLGLPNLDDSFVISLHLPLEGKRSFATIRDPKDLLAFFREAFPDVVDLIPDLVGWYSNKSVNYFGTVRCYPWSCGERVALIGDSAHAIFPFFAQGTNAGFEDCVALDDCLERHGNDWKAVLSAYEQDRKPNADAISDMARDHYLEIRDRVGQPDYTLRLTIEDKLNDLDPERFVPLYTLVTFDTIPYSEALERSRKLQRLVDRLMQVENIEARLDSDLATLVHELDSSSSLHDAL